MRNTMVRVARGLVVLAAGLWGGERQGVSPKWIVANTSGLLLLPFFTLVLGRRQSRTAFGQCLAQHVLDLAIHAAQLLAGPPLELLPELVREPE